MSKKKAKETFEHYNRAADVVRCPSGRAATRKLLDSYARAAVNLYGIISRTDFVDIFNKQNADKTDVEEIYILLLPLVLKDGWYCFYQEFIVHYAFFDDFEQVEFLLKRQANKPRYIPSKDRFLDYVDEDCADNECWWDVRHFMLDAFGFKKGITEGYEAVRNYMTYADGISELGPIMERHHLVFDSDKQLQDFISLIMTAKNNTRIWDNNGYTPSELHMMINKRNEKVIKFPMLQQRQDGRNDPCPCGSGKKYKKCCCSIDDTHSAQLKTDDCRLFYETWYGLMGFVNQRMKLVNANIEPKYPNDVDDMRIHKVREVLWEKPELIDDYIGATELPQEKINILKLWRTNHVKGMFIILDYQPEYAVVLASHKQLGDILYGVKGISHSVANSLQRPLPTQMETVLLPFKGQIIFDSLISTMPIGFADGAKALFREIYDKVIINGIITSLE